MKNEKVEIKLTRYQSVPITLEERKKDLEESIQFWNEERLKKIKRHNRKLYELELDIHKKEVELDLIKRNLNELQSI